jgi:hypothetical protein
MASTIRGDKKMSQRREQNHGVVIPNSEAGRESMITKTFIMRKRARMSKSRGGPGSTVKI